MRIFISFILLMISLTFICCSKDSKTPTEGINNEGKLVVQSDPPGAQIYLRGANTWKVTPDSINDLKPGVYDGFLCLQYYDTAFFSAEVFSLTTTLIDTTLDDAMPFVEFVFDYQMGSNGDSVRFFFNMNQDVTMDNIVVQRPVDLSGNFVFDKYFYPAELFEYQNQFGNPIDYYLPPPQSSAQYYPAYQSRTYYFSMFGHKAHGSKAEFRSLYQVVL